jgi:ATP-dependent DNA helicase RecQ
MDMTKLISEMETIVFSGTKLNINYWVKEILDEDQQEELKEYFMEAETDSIDVAVEEFDGDYEEEDIRIYRLKFISEVGN